MTTLAKTRSRVSPVAIRRALHADRWVPRYRAALQRELNRQVRQVAAEALVLTPDTARHVTQWSETMSRVKRRWVYPIVITGYELAGGEVARVEGGGKSSSGALGKADAPPVPPPVSLGREEGGEFLLRGDFESIDRWVATTSLGESQTSAAKLEKIWKDAAASRDPKTGAAWTPMQISKQILRRGLTGNRHRADMLARTGAIWSVNEGAQQRYRAAGVKAEKWLTTKDDALCFPKDVRVITTSGVRPIGGVCVGDVVLTGAGLGTVARKMISAYEGELVTLSFQGGSLTCTCDHPIWVQPAGWTKAEDVHAGDVLSLTHGEKSRVLGVSTFQLREKVEVYNLEINGDHTFYANGVLVHNCPYCQGMDGKVVSIDEPFWPAGSEYGNPAQVDRSLKLPFEVQHPPLHPRCLVGETPVIATGKIAGLITAYSGPVIEIAFSNSRRLTVTPNHMFLTPRGFARAASLREGDDVLDGSAFERVISTDPDDDRKPTAIKDVVESLAESFGVLPIGVPVSAEDLHGDAAFVNGKVNIVAPDGFLRRDSKASSAEPLLQTNLNATSIRESLLNSSGDLTSMLFALMLASDGGVGVRGEGLAFLRRESLHSELVRITSGAYADASSHETSQNTCAADTEGLRESELRLPFSVPTAHVTGLRVQQFSGHVYDLQSSTTLYIANGLMSSNCRCSLIPVILPGETTPTPEIARPRVGIAGPARKPIISAHPKKWAHVPEQYKDLDLWQGNAKSPLMDPSKIADKPPAFKTHVEAEKWLKQRLPRINFNLDRISETEVLQQVAAGMTKSVIDQPRALKKLRFVGTRLRPGDSFPITEWGKATLDGRRIDINPHWFGQGTVFRKRLHTSVQSKWHPEFCTNISSVIEHEFGHQVQFELYSYAGKLSVAERAAKREASQLVRKVLKKHKKTWGDLSRYAQTDHREAFAEAFSQMHEAKDRLSWNPLTRDLRDALDQGQKMLKGIP